MSFSTLSGSEDLLKKKKLNCCLNVKNFVFLLKLQCLISMHYTLKIKITKGVFCSDAIEEPCLVPFIQRFLK